MMTVPAGTRIGLLTASTSRLGGGVAEMVVRHARLVRGLGLEPVVVTLADRWTDEDRARFGDVPVIACPVVGPAMIGCAPSLGRILADLDLALLHLHGIWMYPSHAAADWARRTRRPFLISPHGMLDPWITGRGVIKKRVARFLYEHRSWRLATKMHALTKHEADDIAAVVHRRDRAIVIPNSVSATQFLPHERGATILYLGRIHPKKNIDALIDAWLLAGDVAAHVGAKLVIAGWGAREDEAALWQKISETGRSDIRFIGPVYGEEKGRLLATARFMALPSHSEGLPVAILESWAAGTPTLMSRHCHLPAGLDAGAALDTGTRADTIAEALRAALTMSPDAWRAMSGAATMVVAEEFSDERIAAAWSEAYDALLRDDQGAP